MKIRSIFVFLLSIAPCSSLQASDAGSIRDKEYAIAERYVGAWSVAELCYENPTVNQWRLSSSLTRIEAEYSTHTTGNNHDYRLGRGEHSFRAGANTYTKYRSSTLWGQANYRNGKIHDMKWNETAHPRLLYPYLLADSVGGDLSQEIYSFGGGYADHKGRWAWGGSMAYEATLQYRTADPRPRNVAGMFSVSLSGMYRMLPQYYVGIGLSAMMYKQTNEISFKNEMGRDKIYHLTGLGTHYNRFAGTGENTCYRGNLLGVDIDLYPAADKGIFATCRISRFAFDNIIASLNQLPLASALHNMLQAQGGWMKRLGKRYGGASFTTTLYRRHGHENIFGDAASSIFPKLGSNMMFADNFVELSATGLFGINLSSISRLQVQVSPLWSHRSMVYVEPYSYKKLNRFTLPLCLSGNILRGPWLLMVSAEMAWHAPYGCRLSLAPADAELNGLYAAERGEYLLESSSMHRFSLKIGATRVIGRHALGLWADGEFNRYSCGSSFSGFSINITFSL